VTTVFFDIGNTLATGFDQSPRRVLGARLALSEKETKRVGRYIMTSPCNNPSSLTTGLETILPGHDPSQLRRTIEKVWEEQIECVRGIEGAAAVVGTLKAEGFKVGVISNTWHPYYDGFLKNCREIAELIDYNILSFRLGFKKPSQWVFHKAMAEAGEEASSCWMIGDTYELDMAPALAIGMRTVWVILHPEKELDLVGQVLRGEKGRPDFTVEKLKDIMPFLLEEVKFC